MSNKTTKPKVNIKAKTRIFTKEEQEIRKNDILKENSKYFEDDELIKFHITKHEVLEYKCYAEKCPTKKGNWRRKKLYLILLRKNYNERDLRETNLTFYCPNCYCQEKGPANFNQFKKKIERKCKLCNYVMNNTFKSDICYVCKSKIKNMDFSLEREERAQLIDTNFNNSQFMNSSNIVADYENIYDAQTFEDNVVSDIPTSTAFKYRSTHSKTTASASSKSLQLPESNISIDLNFELTDDLFVELNNI